MVLDSESMQAGRFPRRTAIGRYRLVKIGCAHFGTDNITGDRGMDGGRL